MSFGEDSCGHLYATSLDGPVYRIDGDTFTPCPEAAPPDTDPPTVTLSGRRAQRVLRRRAFVVAATCDELCGLNASGSFRIAGSRRRYALRPAMAPGNAGVRVRLSLRVSRRGRAAIRRALARRRRVLARITVVAMDPGGNAGRAGRSVRAKR